MISLLVPTMNRSEFVIRLLKYYDSLKFKHYIFIGDSSDPAELEKTNKAVKALKGRLKVEHYHYPGLNNYAVTEQLIQKASTPYSSFLPDDDFYVPNSIEKCVEFLDHNPDYSCAWGKSIIFNLKSRGAYGRFRDLGVSNPGMGYSVENSKIKERLFFYMKNYNSAFTGVCRTAMFKKALRKVSELNRSAETKDIKWWTAEQFGELVASFSLVIQGKIKAIDCLYWIRQNHDKRYLFPDAFDWITSPNWQSCYEIIARQIKEDIIEKYNMPLKEAERVWKKGFWIYLRSGIYEEYQKPYVLPGSIRLQIKRKVKQVLPLYDILINLRNGWRSTISKSIISKRNISLQSALSASFPYYADFMPVYNLVAKSNDALPERS